jgi:hypothetical protein
VQRELQWVYDIAQKIHESELSYLYFMVGTHVQIYSMMSGKFFQIIVLCLCAFCLGYLVAEVDLRLTIPADNLSFNYIALLSHRYAIITSEVSLKYIYGT